MKTDNKIKDLIEKLQSGELDASGQTELNKYFDENPAYKDLIKIHTILENSNLKIPQPETEKFTQMRAAVMRRIRASENRSSGNLERFILRIKEIVSKPEMAVAALTLIMGFFLGRALPPDENSLSSNIISQINNLAKQQTSLEDIKKSPYMYSNVTFKEVDEKNIALSFDVTTHLDMVGQKNDPLVRDVIAQSLVNPTNLGSELKAISYTEGVLDHKIKEALIYSMHHAPILAVRLKAMDNLMTYKNDPEVQDAIIKVLTDEESVKMRLMAIDYLSASNLKPDTLKKIVAESNAPQNPALMIKVKKYENTIE